MNTSVLQNPSVKRVLGIIAAVAVVMTLAGVMVASQTAEAKSAIEIDTGNTKLANARSSDLKSDITTIINYGLGFAGLIAVIFLLYGGIMYIISGGEQDRIDTAKNTIIYAIVGLIVIMLAFVVVSAVGRILG